MLSVPGPVPDWLLEEELLIHETMSFIDRPMGSRVRDSFRLADLHVSLCQGEKDSPEARFGGARTANSGRTRSSHACLSAMVPAFAEPDIHSLSQVLADRHRRLSVCSLPVLKQFEESLGSLISVAQSATAGPGSLRAV